MNRKLFNELSIPARSSLGPAKKIPAKKKYIRLKELIEIYSIGRTKATQLAKRANALVKIDCTALVDIDAFQKYIDEHRCSDD